MALSANAHAAMLRPAGKGGPSVAESDLTARSLSVCRMKLQPSRPTVHRSLHAACHGSEQRQQPDCRAACLQTTEQISPWFPALPAAPHQGSKHRESQTAGLPACSQLSTSAQTPVQCLQATVQPAWRWETAAGPSPSTQAQGACWLMHCRHVSSLISCLQTTVRPVSGVLTCTWCSAFAAS